MTNNALTDLTVAQLKRAIAIKGRIEELEAELSSVLGAGGPISGGARATGAPQRRRMSVAARAKIAAAARARWAKVNAGKTAKRKRTMSPASRAKIAAAA